MWWLFEAACAGRSYAGVPPPPRPRPVRALPEPQPGRVRVVGPAPIGWTADALSVRQIQVPTEGQLLLDAGSRVQVLFSLGEVELALWIGEEGLARVPVRPVSLLQRGEGWVMLWPGAPWEEGRHVQSGLEVTGQLEAQDLGNVWTPEPRPEPLSLHLASPAALSASPGGEILAQLSPDPDLSVKVTGPARQGWLPVEVHTPWAAAVGYLPASAVGEETSPLRGVASGGGARLALDPGVQLLDPDTGSGVGRVTERLYVGELVSGADWAYVALDTPWGPLAAEVRCAPIDRDEGVCKPR
jgi:hypothetical protein